MQQSPLNWRLRGLINSKVISSIPLTREGILDQVKYKIRQYMEDQSQPQSPKSTKRMIRSPVRKSSGRLGPSMLLTFHQQKDIVQQAPEMKKLLFEAIEEKNTLRLLQLCLRLAATAIENGWPTTLAASLLLFGWIFQEVKEFELSCYIFIKCASFTTVMQHDLYKAECLLALGKNLRLLMRYSDSMKCLKKSLQYLWRASRRQPLASEALEIELYQELAYTLLHTNELEHSKYFRNRYERGTVESRNSNIIKLSNDILTTMQRDKVEIATLTPNISVMLGVDFVQLETKISAARKDRHSFSAFKDASEAFLNDIWANPLQSIFDVNFNLLMDKFLVDSGVGEEIPLPTNGSNEKLFADIDAYIEKRNRKRLVSPVKYRSNMGMDMFERKSRARQVGSKKGVNLFSEKVQSNNPMSKSHSVSGIPQNNNATANQLPTAVRTGLGKSFSKTRVMEHFVNFLNRIRHGKYD